MDEEVGEIEYDVDARLYFGATKYSDNLCLLNYMH